MSLPWKKTKQSRISRFMSEFQQTPKRGGSLVVETGFPASLIDLFFKNRDRLKKSSLKRLKRKTQTAQNLISSVTNSNVVLEKPAPVQSKIEEVNFATTVESNNYNSKNANEKSVCVSGCGTAFVLMAFKVLIVMLLALSTKKKLTVGITLSAFALLLTELIAARLLSRFNRPCSEKVKPVLKKETCVKETEQEAVVTEKPSLKQEMFTVRDLLLKDEKSTSKSSRLKSKIVKKLKSYKKKKGTVVIKEEESLSEVSSLVSEDKPEIIEEPPLMESKGEQTIGIGVMIVIVLVGLLGGKILAIGLTLSCLCLAKRSGLCK